MHFDLHTHAFSEEEVFWPRFNISHDQYPAYVSIPWFGKYNQVGKHYPLIGWTTWDMYRFNSMTNPHGMEGMLAVVCPPFRAKETGKSVLWDASVRSFEPEGLSVPLTLSIELAKEEATVCICRPSPFPPHLTIGTLQDPLAFPLYSTTKPHQRGCHPSLINQGIFFYCLPCLWKPTIFHETVLSGSGPWCNALRVKSNRDATLRLLSRAGKSVFD